MDDANTIAHIINNSGGECLEPGEIITSWIVIAEGEHPQTGESRILVVNEDQISTMKAVGMLEMSKYALLAGLDDDED